jgi:hypothetical protein
MFNFRIFRLHRADRCKKIAVERLSSAGAKPARGNDMDKNKPLNESRCFALVSSDLLNRRLELLERLAKAVDKYDRCGCSWGVVQKALKALRKSEAV